MEKMKMDKASLQN